jgi:hypothetical protein
MDNPFNPLPLGGPPERGGEAAPTKSCWELAIVNREAVHA